MSSRSAVRDFLRRRWVRRTLVGGIVLSAAYIALTTVASTGGVVVRDDDGCPRSVGSLGSVSWVDVLHIEGRTYERVDIVAPHESRVERAELSERLGAIECAIAEDVQDAGYDLRNGEATFLAPGTPVHALSATDVGFRVAAIDDGQPVVYEHRPSTGASGAELLPFPARDVVTVTFLSDTDGRTVLGQITEPETVRDFVQALQEAPVGERPNLGEEPRVFVALEFADQPPVTVVTYPRPGVTTAGLRLPDTVLAQIPPPDQQ